jgi:hypothetical protein
MEREKWWTYSREFERQRLFCGTVPEPKPDRRTAATYRRIADLHPALGRQLDDSLAPQRVVKWVAWSPHKVECPRNLIQQLRLNAVMRVYAQCSRWPLQDELRLLAEEVARLTAWEPVVEPDAHALPAAEVPAAQEGQELSPAHAQAASSPPADLDPVRCLSEALGPDHPNLASIVAAARRAWCP